MSFSRQDNTKRAIAPYRRPEENSNRVSKQNNKQNKGFIGKLKKLVSFNWNENHNRGDASSTTVRTHEQQLLAKGGYSAVPGGFFNSSQSSQMLQERSRVMNESSRIADDADTSNAKLADFFAKKGNEPLSEIEMEGVMALIHKSRTRTDDSSILGSSSKLLEDISSMNNSHMLRSGKAPSMSDMKIPSFEPNYENETRDKSIIAESSTTNNTPLKRKNYDYSSIRSPYRTVIYRFDDHNKKRLTSYLRENDGQVLSDEIETSVKDKPLSTTATALVSLLEGNTESKSSIESLANPFSSHSSILRENKKKISQPVCSAFEDKINVPKKPHREISGDISEPKAEKKVTNEKTLEGNNVNSEQKALSTDIQGSFSKYKPTRSSSLRASVSTPYEPKTDELEKGSNKKIAEGKEAIPEKEPVSQSTSEDIQQKKPFSFSSGPNNKVDSLKSSMAIQQKEVAPATTPAASIFNQPKPTPVADTPVTLVPKSSPTFNFGAQNDAKKEETLTKVSYDFEFPQPPLSDFVGQNIDDSLVTNYKSQYIF
ncbi:FG-nucleoporin NUP60 [Nakaseomyces bracarensis]|uniref:FG-nucleoporin NUP60 n=1 Tax=Nakaseomyces bracarensis TaxID=273131 RepID=UPI0038720313